MQFLANTGIPFTSVLLEALALQCNAFCVAPPGENENFSPAVSLRSVGTIRVIKGHSPKFHRKDNLGVRQSNVYR